MKDKNKKKTIIVLGVPRSGTSLTAGILDYIGVDMGGRKLRESHVPKGSFEDAKFGEFFKLSLNELGIDYKASGGEDIFWSKKCPNSKQFLSLKNKFKKKIKKLIKKRSKNKKIWGFKNPVTHTIIDFFMPYLENVYFVVVLRDPKEILRSAEQVFPYFKIENDIDVLKKVNVVRLHYLRIFEILKKYKRPFIFVNFKGLIANPFKQTVRLADFINLDLTPKKIRKVKRFVISNKKKRGFHKLLGKFLVFIDRGKRFLKKCKKNPKKIPEYICHTFKKNILRQI